MNYIIVCSEIVRTIGRISTSKKKELNKREPIALIVNDIKRIVFIITTFIL